MRRSEREIITSSQSQSSLRTSQKLFETVRVVYIYLYSTVCFGGSKEEEFISSWTRHFLICILPHHLFTHLCICICKRTNSTNKGKQKQQLLFHCVAFSRDGCAYTLDIIYCSRVKPRCACLSLD